MATPPAFACLRCTNPSYESEHIPNNVGIHDYLRGDILKIKESVHVVCEDHILAAAASICGAVSYLQPSRYYDDRGVKARPAILRQRRPQALGGTALVCLCATFQGKSRRDCLPEVLRYFSVALHPHEIIPSEPHNLHLHTVPEWTEERAGKPNGWVIAVEYRSNGDIGGHWLNRARVDQQSSSSFTIVDDHNSDLHLHTLCQEKWRNFIIHCNRNKDAFRLLKDDYEVSMIASTQQHRCLIPVVQEWKRNRAYQAATTTAVRYSSCMRALWELTDTRTYPLEYVYSLRHTGEGTCVKR